MSDLVGFESGVVLAEFMAVSSEDAVAEHLAGVEDMSSSFFFRASCKFVGFVPFVDDGFYCRVFEHDGDEVAS